MPYDDNLIFKEFGTTETGAVTGPWLQVNGQVPIDTVFRAEVIYNAAGTATGTKTVTYNIEESDDKTTVTTAATRDLVLTTTPAKGKFHIPYSTRKKFIRLTTVWAGSGTTPTITHGAADTRGGR